ncbi:MAG: RNA methyltransferase [Oscillospiraceae bacterium]|jgi:TrmH family RNA methyltransferase|nr:RNA methyltransferase [Oscillospiraceae bacterium]
MFITSRQNPLIKHLRRLGADAAYRREQGLFLADGRKLLDDVLKSGVVPCQVVAAEGVPLPQLPDAAKLAAVPAALMDAVSPLESPQGVLFVCGIPAPPPAPPRSGRWLLLDRLQDPGNVGSILRTAEAFALDGVYLTPGSADPFSPKAVRAAMGATFRLSAGFAPVEELLSGPLPLAVADMGGGNLSGLENDCIVALGSEGQGIAPGLKRKANRILSIPMPGKAESLGVAAAAAIICWAWSATARK